jgi:hypothetical protein
MRVLDLAPGLRVVGFAKDLGDPSVAEPVGEIARDVVRPLVRQPARLRVDTQPASGAGARNQTRSALVAGSARHLIGF